MATTITLTLRDDGSMRVESELEKMELLGALELAKHVVLNKKPTQRPMVDGAAVIPNLALLTNGG